MQVLGFFILSAWQVLGYIIASILLLVLGTGIGYYIFKKQYEKAGKSAEKLIEDTNKAVEENRKKVLIETKQEVFRLKQENEKEIRNFKHEAEREIKDRRRSAADLENKLAQREERIDNRSINLDKREESLNHKEQRIDNIRADLEKQSSKLDELIEEQNLKLFKVSGLSVEEAKQIILDRVEEDMSLEIAAVIKEAEDKAKLEVNRKAQSLLANAIQQYAADAVMEKTVSVVPLPNDEMKGRIIGREGRNIRAIEASTGVDIIIDDTPEAVVLSCFDPIRREVARRTMETLIADGRIQPSRIEELVTKFQKELDVEIREAGEKAVFEVGVGRVHPELIKLIGRLKYRTSYGQNALAHSMEVAFLTGMLASEIGLNEVKAKRAGLLHDIGKAVDHEMEGSHVDIGVELAHKFKESHEVIDAIASHHGDYESTSIISQLVAAADTLSAARPGARSESLENYIKRLTKLEEICNEFKGVDKSYALQAGREIRILVKPEEIDDVETHKLARDIRQKIESNINYPGTIKVTVIRETRVHEVAK